MSVKKSTPPAFQAKPSWELISQGAEARIWKIPDYLPKGRAAVAKERFAKSYRHPILDERLTKSRCKGEAKALVRARRAGVSCPAIWGVQPPVLYIEYLEGHTVRQCLEEAAQSSNGSDSEEPKASSLATQIGNIIANLHNAGVVHGDLTTSNMMMMSGSGEICLIDFGLARVSQNPEELAVDLYVLERALVSTHPEVEDNGFNDEVLKAYKATCKKGDAVLQRLSSVRARGRKRECFG